MDSFAFILFSAYLELLGFIGTPRLYKPGTIDLPIAISSQLDSKGGNHHQTVRLRLREDAKIYAAPHPQLHSEMSPNLACGGAKCFSHPPYSQHDFIYFETESGFEHFGDFDAAPPRQFLNFYLEPPNLPPFNPKIDEIFFLDF